MQRFSKNTANKPNEHLFSPHTDQCIYCGKSAEDDVIENTPCQRPPCKSCGGRGWLITDTGNDDLSRYEIQRCDACEFYETDIAAFEAVEKVLKSHAALLKLVQAVAELRHEHEPDDQGSADDRPSEESIVTLNEIIMDARKLLGTAEKCEECGEMVSYVIGCPDGSEVCQACFDAGQH